MFITMTRDFEDNSLKKKILIFRYFCIKTLRLFSKLSFLIPLRNNQILLIAYNGKEYSDSPRYISDYIQKRDQKNDLIMYWAIKEPERYKDIETKNLRFIEYRSLRFALEHMRSKFIITNIGPMKAIAGRKGQEIISTWHGGGAYKKVGIEKYHQSKAQLSIVRLVMKDVTLVLSSSKAFTDVCIHDAFHYDGNVLNAGLPRNDILLKSDVHYAIKENVKKYFSLPSDMHIVLYAPTWRRSELKNAEKIDYKELLNSLQNRFSGDWIILYRAHNMMNRDDMVLRNNSLLDATDYPDMQELLIAADVLITDYSSSIWDYSLLKKPGFLFVPDLEYYEENNGLCTPIEKWGFAVCKTNEELKQKIRDYDQKEQIRAISENHKLFHSYETGKACEYVYDYIMSKI